MATRKKKVKAKAKAKVTAKTKVSKKPVAKKRKKGAAGRRGPSTALGVSGTAAKKKGPATASPVQQEPTQQLVLAEIIGDIEERMALDRLAESK